MFAVRTAAERAEKMAQVLQAKAQDSWNSHGVAVNCRRMVWVRSNRVRLLKIEAQKRRLKASVHEAAAP